MFSLNSLKGNSQLIHLFPSEKGSDLFSEIKSYVLIHLLQGIFMFILTHSSFLLYFFYTVFQLNSTVQHAQEKQHQNWFH